ESSQNASTSLSSLSPLALDSFFFLLQRPPPTPPLFPYTTLFRSGRPHPLRVGDAVAADLLVRRGVAHDLPLAVVGDGFGAGALQDRKSTRLNSSHSQISYAVFCLKKKKL